MAGSGKSTVVKRLNALLARNGVSFLLLDPEDEAASLVDELGPDRVGILDYWQVPLAPFAPPGIERLATDDEHRRALMVYLTRLMGVFERQWVGTGGANELLRIIESELASGAALHNFSPRITWREVCAAVRRKSNGCRHDFRIAAYLAGLENRMEGLGAALPGIHCRSSSLMDFLLKKPLIIRTHGLEARPRDFLFELLQLQVCVAAEHDYHAHDQSRPRLVINAEEAYRLVRDDDTKSPVMGGIYTAGRKRGLIALSVTQTIAHVSPTIIGNSSLRFIFCLPGAACRKALANVMRLDQKRDEALASLPRKRFLVSAAEWGPEPLLVEADETPGRSYPPEETIRKWCAATLAQLRFELDKESRPASGPATQAVPAAVATPAPVPANPTRGASLPAAPSAAGVADVKLSPHALSVLADLAAHPDLIEGRAERLKLSLSEEANARRELEKAGLMEESPERLGRNRRFFLLTAKGEAVARAHHVRPATYKSGIIHEYCVRQTVARVCMRLTQWRTRRSSISYGNVQLDALLLGPGGRLVGVQISHASNPRQEAANLQTLCACGELDLVLVIGTSKAKAESIRRAVASLCGGIPPKVLLFDFESFLDCRDLKSFLESDCKSTGPAKS
jgi:DNA-binding MarR family transcriptional regulator